MSILSTENLGLSFGDFDLFRGINLTLASNSKIGLIGPNGIGKTSLLLMIAGQILPTEGRVHLARGRRLAYLHQEAIEAFADRSNTVYAEMLAVFAELQRQQAQLHEMEQAMAAGETNEAMLHSYGDLQQAFELAGGYDYELRIQQTLQGLGLGREMWSLPLNHLSGGQKTQALLARLLLEKPDLLMLDEPTNHLDLESIDWLERTLADWQGAFVIISHDRFFLDNTVTTIWEMTRNGIEAYPGNYSAYLLQRQERWEYYARVVKEEKERLLKEVDFVQRNWVRASTHARALGLLRRLSRDLAVIDAYGIMALRSGKKWSEMDLSVRPLDVIEAIRKVNAIRAENHRPPRIRPRLAASHTSGNLVLRAAELTVGYPGRPLFTTHDLELRRGECTALIGPNGAGKTSLLKTMLGQIEPYAGEIVTGASLKIGYFAQAQEDLKGERTVLDELTAHKEMPPGEARSLLAQYLFTGEDVFKPVSALSGGERARLALAILALAGANFLVLDEPTNHLDIPAREALQQVLEDYRERGTGTILLVSHDRYLIDRLATQIWEVRDGQLTVFTGSYREFLLQRAGKRPEASPKPVLPPRPIVRQDGIAARRKMEALAQLEERIYQKELVVQRLTRELQEAGQWKNFESVHSLSRKVAQAQAMLEGLLEEWERLAA